MLQNINVHAICEPQVQLVLFRDTFWNIRVIFQHRYNMSNPQSNEFVGVACSKIIREIDSRCDEASGPAKS